MRSRRAAALWGLAVAYAAAIFVVSSIPSPPPPETPVGLVSDKFLHALEYGVFALLLAFAIGSAPPPPARRWAPVLALAFCAVYAATDEFHQSLVPGRLADVEDFVWDVAGAAVGASLHRTWTWRAGLRSESVAGK